MAACPGNSSDLGNYHCANNMAIVGALLGFATAITLDAAVLARETVQVNRRPLQLAPSFSLNRSGINVGLVGEF
jgi:hypothetical protein